MRPQSSTGLSESQQDYTGLRQIAARLREERHRVEPHQGRFAQRIGISQGKWSHIETGRTEVRAQDLAAAAAAGIDVHYVLTGEHIVGEVFEASVAEMLEGYASLSPRMQKIARSLISALVNESRGEVVAMQEEQQPFHSD